MNTYTISGQYLTGYPIKNITYKITTDCFIKAILKAEELDLKSSRLVT